MRLSATAPAWTDRPLLHAVVLETVFVHPSRWRQGICKRFIESLVADPRYELVVVEAVQNAHLYDALLRWDWHCDRGVGDFYWPKSDAARAACALLDQKQEDRDNERRQRRLSSNPWG